MLEYVHIIQYSETFIRSMLEAMAKEYDLLEERISQANAEEPYEEHEVLYEAQDDLIGDWEMLERELKARAEKQATT
jgi:hypothetical protein